jgi:hypothetical protein
MMVIRAALRRPHTAFPSIRAAETVTIEHRVTRFVRFDHVARFTESALKSWLIVAATTLPVVQRFVAPAACNSAITGRHGSVDARLQSAVSRA